MCNVIIINLPVLGPEEELKEEKPVHETPEESPIPPYSNSTLNSTESLDKTNTTEQVKLNDTVHVGNSKKNLKVVTIKETIDVNHEYLFVLSAQGDDLQNSINKYETITNRNY